jgi:hypothetical protein
MSSAVASATGFDLFLSHATADKAWVRRLKEELERQRLRPFLDERELKAGANWVLELSDGLLRSRFLVLVLSRETATRPWVEQEWSSFLAKHGPGRLFVVLRESDVELPTILSSVQAIRALDGDAARVARELVDRVGHVDELTAGDTRRLTIGQDLVFDLDLTDEFLAMDDPSGRRRDVTTPWRADGRFGGALRGFRTLTRQPLESDAERAELNGHAAALGDALCGVLFDAEGQPALRTAMAAGRPLITLRSGADVLLALPWELIRLDGQFLVRDGRVDLARSVPIDADHEPALPEPSGPLVLAVNVSAPEGSGLDYEGESYRITRALSGRCRLEPTELGTLGDLVATTARARPTGVHFSGHGGPGRLVFEDDEGRPAPASLAELVRQLRVGVPGGLPSFFYLANCHGNTPDDGAAATSLAAGLHREGVCQVVGYAGPISDELSTQAEVALYAAIADGQTTRFAVGKAREALFHPTGERGTLLRDRLPLAWSQLVFYHRGPDHPLGRPAASGPGRPEADLPERTFLDAGTRRVLATGFIGRRTELHRIRKRLRRGDRICVFQGLGGLGKTTLAFHTLPLLGPPEARLTLWCQDAEKYREGHDPIAEALVGQLLKDCRRRFGLEWEGVVQQVDRVAGDDAARRFAYFLGELLQNVPRLVIYLDNMESLLVGPDETRAEPPPAQASRQTWWSPLARLLGISGERARVFAPGNAESITCAFQVFGRIR